MRSMTIDLDQMNAALTALKQSTRTTLAQQIAHLAAHWVAQQIAPELPPDLACATARAWRRQTPLQLALLPDIQRPLAAATQELVLLLAQFPEGWQALADLGFEPFLEDIERP